MSFLCTFCNSCFTTSYTLLNHQKKAKYCLEKQGIMNTNYTCSKCSKNLSDKRLLESHEEKCGVSIKNIQYQNRSLEITIKTLEEKLTHFENNDSLSQETIKNLEDKLIESKTVEKLLREKIEDQSRQIQDLQNKLENIAIKGATKSTSTNILNILQPLIEQELNEQGRNITIEDIKGAKRLAQFAADNSLKGKVVTSDASRCILKYKNPNGEIVRDKNGIKITKMFCKSIEEPVKKTLR
jgi:hypothetical protein